MINRVFVAALHILLAGLILIQKDEYGQLLINGHISLAAVTIILLISALYHLIWATVIQPELDYDPRAYWGKQPIDPVMPELKNSFHRTPTRQDWRASKLKNIKKD